MYLSTHTYEDGIVGLHILFNQEEAYVIRLATINTGNIYFEAELTTNYTDTVEYETQSVWGGCRCGHPGAGCYCSSETVRTGRVRTVRNFHPKKDKGEWQEKS